MQTAQLCGELESHIVYRSFADGLYRHGLTRACWQAFGQLQKAAAAAGFDLRIVSAFRNAERQQLIWDAKALGRRAVLDADCRPLDINCLSAEETLFAILRWSAIPGTSRHHWGTDLDIYDAAAVPEDYGVQLVLEEYSAGGPFAAMNQWLNEQIGGDNSFGFFKPYAQDNGGVAPEPWHLSFAPEAWPAQQQLGPEALLEAVRRIRPQLVGEIEHHWPQIYNQYIAIPEQRYPAQYRE